MTSASSKTLLHIDPTCKNPSQSTTSLHLCSVLNERVPGTGLAVCSLSSAPHGTHQLLCEDTGEVLGEWTDADTTFREPADLLCYFKFADVA